MKFEVWIYGHTYIIDHTLIYDAVFRGVREWFFGICKTTPAACILGGWQCHGWCLGPLLYRAGHLHQKTEISERQLCEGRGEHLRLESFQKILRSVNTFSWSCFWMHLAHSENSWVSWHFRSFYILAPIKMHRSHRNNWTTMCKTSARLSRVHMQPKMGPIDRNRSKVHQKCIWWSRSRCWNCFKWSGCIYWIYIYALEVV